MKETRIEDGTFEQGLDMVSRLAVDNQSTRKFHLKIKSKYFS